MTKTLFLFTAMHYFVWTQRTTTLVTMRMFCPIDSIVCLFVSYRHSCHRVNVVHHHPRFAVTSYKPALEAITRSVSAASLTPGVFITTIIVFPLLLLTGITTKPVLLASQICESLQFVSHTSFEYPNTRLLSQGNTEQYDSVFPVHNILLVPLSYSNTPCIANSEPTCYSTNSTNLNYLSPSNDR